MKHLNKSAQAIFETLTDGLVDVSESNFPEKQTHRTFGEDGGAFMAVHVERLARNLFSIAHYFEQNGDLCCDPDMTFKTAGDKVEVCEFQQAIPPTYQRVDDLSPREIKSMVEFANQWMRNIKDQQGL